MEGGREGALIGRMEGIDMEGGREIGGKTGKGIEGNEERKRDRGRTGRGIEGYGEGRKIKTGQRRRKEERQAVGQG